MDLRIDHNQWLVDSVLLQMKRMDKKHENILANIR
jgi:hypothetical protein